MRLRGSASIDRARISIVLPAALAAALVIALAIQSVRSVQLHRRVVENSLRDYAAFATWQYTRRASDYLRLVITAALSAPQRVAAGACESRADGVTSCATQLPVDGVVGCAFDGRLIRVTRNTTPLSTSVLRSALDSAFAHSTASRFGIGMVQPAGDSRFVAYWFRLRPSDGEPECTALVFGDGALKPILRHVAQFAPLLPPSVTGNLPNDSLISIRVRSAGGMLLDSIGHGSVGMTAFDVLGPDLAGIRIDATLHPAAVRRLTGVVPESNAYALAAMLGVAMILCAIAVWQLRRSQEILRLRSDFVAAVSHELKTPLTQISLFADTLASPRERSADDRARYLTIISREAKRLGHLVDSILHFAGAMRPGDRPPATERRFLGEEIGAAIAAFEPIAAARGATIETVIADEVELTLDADAFRQLMLNLLDNALKFGPDGQHITVSARRAEAMSIITVDDQGPGIPEGDRERVFAPFIRADRGNGRSGSGIGLAVVRDVAQRHGGTVQAVATPSGGARFIVSLPIR